MLKYIEKESHKSYLGCKEWKAMFQVASWSDTHFAFARLLLLARSSTQVKKKEIIVGEINTKTLVCII